MNTYPLRRLADRLSVGIMTGHDWPNTDDELLRLQCARMMREAADELRRMGLEIDAQHVCIEGRGAEICAIRTALDRLLNTCYAMDLEDEGKRPTEEEYLAACSQAQQALMPSHHHHA